MSTTVGDFFLSANAVHGVTEEDYEKINFLISTVKAFARSTYQSVYVIDYFKEGFAYVSDNLAYLCGHPAERIKEFGYELYINHVPDRDLEMLKEINKKGFDFINELPAEERMEYSITYDFHLMNGRRQRLVSHRITPLVLTGDGRVWLALCTVAMSAHDKPGNIIMKKEKCNTFYEYSLDRHKWIKKAGIALSDTERDVLMLSTQGYTMNDISDRLCKSVDTIKACKRNMFAKMNVRNIAEALSYAINYRLI